MYSKVSAFDGSYSSMKKLLYFGFAAFVCFENERYLVWKQMYFVELVLILD